MPALEHTYRDRWQTSLRDAWEADRDARSDESFSRLLALLEERDREVEAYLRTTTATTVWTQPTLVNSWVDYGGAFALIAYRKVGDIVQLRGTAKDGTLNTTAFTLPVGFRPAATYRIGTCDGSIDVATSGAVGFYALSSSIFSIDGAWFSTVTA